VPPKHHPARFARKLLTPASTLALAATFVIAGPPAVARADEPPARAPTTARPPATRPVVSKPHAAPDAAPANGDAMSDAGVHFGRGVTLYGEADYPAALVEFTRAYELAPTWRVLFNIGQAHFQLHEYVDALTALQRFLDEGGDQVKPKQRELVQSELASLADRIGRVTIRCNVAGATISVDDQVIGTTPLSNPVPMSAGIRRVSATHEGQAPVEERLSVAGGDTLEVHLDFAFAAAPPAEPAPVKATAPPPPASVSADWRVPEREVRPPNRLPPAIAFGVAAAGAAVGGIFGVLALDDRSRLDHACADKACPASSQSDIQGLSRDAWVSNIGFGVAVAAVATGITLWLIAPSTSASPGPQTSWKIGPGWVTGTF
jgi:hypothetical protein